MLKSTLYNMDTSAMHTILNDIFDHPEVSSEAFKAKYPDFFAKYPVLSEKVFDPAVDKATLKYMLEQKQRIESNRSSEYDASVKVGSMLVDRYVKPDLERRGQQSDGA